MGDWFAWADEDGELRQPELARSVEDILDAVAYLERWSALELLTEALESFAASKAQDRHVLDLVALREARTTSFTTGEPSA